MKSDEIKFENIPKTDEEYISVRYGCIKFIDSYRLLSSSLDKLVKTLVDNSHKTLKDLEEKIVDNVEILIFVNELKIIFKEEYCKNDSIRDFRKDYPEEFINLEEALFIYMGENDLEILKTELPDKWKD